MNNFVTCKDLPTIVTIVTICHVFKANIKPSVLGNFAHIAVR